MKSITIKNETFDYSFVTQSIGTYLFYLGDMRVGHIFKDTPSWTAAAPYPYANKMGVVKGFHTRIDAANYLLKLQGYIR